MGAASPHALTDWAIDEARRQGFEELYLTVYVDNHRARRFYDRYGFEAVGPYDFMVGETGRRGRHHAENAVSEVEVIRAVSLGACLMASLGAAAVYRRRGFGDSMSATVAMTSAGD